MAGQASKARRQARRLAAQGLDAITAPSSSDMARNPALRGKVVAPLRNGARKSSATKLTATMPSGDGNGKSYWTRTPYVKPCTPEATPKWDHTVSTVAGR